MIGGLRCESYIKIDKSKRYVPMRLWQKGNMVLIQTIQQRIDQILSVETIEEMCQYNLGGCHKLKGDRKGQYAMKLPNGLRLIFNVTRDLVQIAEIMDITDYH